MRVTVYFGFQGVLNLVVAEDSCLDTQLFQANEALKVVESPEKSPKSTDGAFLNDVSTSNV